MRKTQFQDFKNVRKKTSQYKTSYETAFGKSFFGFSACTLVLIQLYQMKLIEILNVNEIPSGTMKMVKIESQEILIANINGDYYAIENRCSHKNGDLSKGSLDNNIVTCPVHGSRVDVRTGKAIEGPKILFFRAKTNDQLSYQVKIEDEILKIRI